MSAVATTSLHRRQFRSADPKRRMIGWVVVVLVHVVVLWALITGTARKGLEIIKKPLEAAVIEEVIIPPPPPPPPKIVKPPEMKAPKVEAPPPPFVPPPEVTPHRLGAHAAAHGACDRAAGAARIDRARRNRRGLPEPGQARDADQGRARPH
jgi:hypothetical protein